jgi:hypothetical protein
MSEHIVHTGILEDSIAIMPYLKEIPEDFLQAAQRHIGFARLGCITVSGDTYSFRLLEEYKPLWKKRDDLLEAKLAFVLGWVSHRACDREMKPIWHTVEISGRGSDANPAVSPTECSVYHEGTLYNLYYSEDPAFHLAIFPSLLADWTGAELVNLPLMAEFVESSYAMNMMNIQTILPPSLEQQSSDQRFIEDVCLQAQKFYVDISRYARASSRAVPDLKKSYVIDINWYDEKDLIVALVSRLRRGEKLAGPEVKESMDSPASSHYGRALQLSLRYIISAAAYFTDDNMSIETLKERLDIGKKGPGGLGV